jgi:hypothetical protein
VQSLKLSHEYIKYKLQETWLAKAESRPKHRSPILRLSLPLYLLSHTIKAPWYLISCFYHYFSDVRVFFSPLIVSVTQGHSAKGLPSPSFRFSWHWPLKGTNLWIFLQSWNSSDSSQCLYYSPPSYFCYFHHCPLCILFNLFFYFKLLRLGLSCHPGGNCNSPDSAF